MTERDEMDELDAYLAKAMEWEPRVWYPGPSHLWPVLERPPCPTRNAADALKLLDWLACKGWSSRHEAGKHYCQLDLFDGSQTLSALVDGPPSESVPLAISLAAKEAIEAMESEGRGEHKAN